MFQVDDIFNNQEDHFGKQKAKLSAPLAVHTLKRQALSRIAYIRLIDSLEVH